MKSLSSSGVKNILLVDDDKTFLQSVLDGLDKYSKDIKVFTAENGSQAIELLKSKKMDLVITDLKMPQVDGFELLTFMNNHYSTIPVIVITAFGTPEVKWNIENLGALQYLEKPMTINELADRIKKGLATKSDGFVQSIITLPSLLNLIQNEKKTCTLKVKSKGKTGSFYFNNGELLYCRGDLFQGEEAVFEILKWGDKLVTVFNGCNNKERNVYLPISELLLVDSDSNKGKSQSRKKSKKYKEEVSMKVKKITEMVEILKEDLGDALIAADIWAVVDGRSIAAHNPQPKASALFNRITKNLEDALRESEFPPMDGYYCINLADKILALVIPLKDFQMGMLVDTKQFQEGLLLNVTLPKVLKAFNEAIED